MPRTKKNILQVGIDSRGRVFVVIRERHRWSEYDGTVLLHFTAEELFKLAERKVVEECLSL